MDYKTPPVYPAFLRRLTDKTNKLLYINAKMNFSKPRFSDQQSLTHGLHKYRKPKKGMRFLFHPECFLYSVINESR